MSRRQEVRQIAMRLALIDQEIERLKHERISLESQFNRLVPDDAPSTGNGVHSGPTESMTERVLHYVAKRHSDEIFTPATLATEMGANRKSIRNTLLRIAKPGDRRIINTGMRGNYRFRSLTKETPVKETHS
jgi:hypothetical protein